MSSSTDLDNGEFARHMALRRARAKFPELPSDVLPCARCAGSGESGGCCAKCDGFGFHRSDGSIAKIHSAKGGFYRWGAADAIVESMLNVKLAYAGPSPAKENGIYNGKFTFSIGDELWRLITSVDSARFRKRGLAEVSQGAVDGVELWLLPTPAPARALLRAMLTDFSEHSGSFVVWSHRPFLAKQRNRPSWTLKPVPVFEYRALDHYALMQSEPSVRERVASVIACKHVIHPLRDNDVPATTPRPLRASFKRLPVMGELSPQDAQYPVNNQDSVKKLAHALSSSVGLIAVTFELRPERGVNIWDYSPTIEIMTL